MRLVLLALAVASSASAFDVRTTEPGSVQVHCEPLDPVSAPLLAHDGAGNWRGILHVRCPWATYGYVQEEHGGAGMPLKLNLKHVVPRNIQSRWTDWNDSVPPPDGQHFFGGMAIYTDAENITFDHDTKHRLLPTVVYLMCMPGRMHIDRYLVAPHSGSLLRLDLGVEREARCPVDYPAWEADYYDFACDHNLFIPPAGGSPETLTAMRRSMGSSFTLRLPEGWTVEHPGISELIRQTNDGVVVINPSSAIAMNVTVDIDHHYKLGTYLLGAGGNVTIPIPRVVHDVVRATFRIGNAHYLTVGTAFGGAQRTDGNALYTLAYDIAYLCFFSVVLLFLAVLIMGLQALWSIADLLVLAR